MERKILAIQLLLLRCVQTTVLFFIFGTYIIGVLGDGKLVENPAKHSQLIIGQLFFFLKKTDIY